MELKSEPAFTETPVTDWEFATIGGTRVFTLEDGVDSCCYYGDISEYFKGGHPDRGGPCFVVTEARTNEVTVIFVGPGLIGYTQRGRVKRVPVKPTGPALRPA